MSARVSRFSGLPWLFVELSYEKQRIDMLQPPQAASVVSQLQVEQVRCLQFRKEQRDETAGWTVILRIFLIFSRVGLLKMKGKPYIIGTAGAGNLLLQIDPV